jgi:hypothetical protein
MNTPRWGCFELLQDRNVGPTEDKQIGSQRRIASGAEATRGALEKKERGQTYRGS